MGRVGDTVWRVVEDQGRGLYQAKEIFLRLFDTAVEIQERERVVDSFAVKDNNVKTGYASDDESESNNNEENGHLLREIDNLKEENNLLKSEIEEKIKNIVTAETNLEDLQIKLRRLTEAFSRVESENTALQSDVVMLNCEKVKMLKKFSEKETVFEGKVETLENALADKHTEYIELSNEQSATLSSLERLGDEVEERDLVIEALTTKLEEVAGLLEQKEEERLLEQEQELLSTPRGRGRRETPTSVLSFQEEQMMCLGQELEQARDAWEEEERSAQEKEQEQEDLRQVEERRRNQLSRLAVRVARVEEGLRSRVRWTEGCLARLGERNRGALQMMR